MGDPAKRYARANLYPCQFSSALYVEPCDRCPDCRFQAVLAERDRAVRERDVAWQALTDIAGWENWQRPTWREIARDALSRLHPDPPEQEGQP